MAFGYKATHIKIAMFLTVGFLFSGLLLATPAHAQVYGAFEDDLTVRVAVMIGRAAEIIPEADMPEIIDSLERQHLVPPRYRTPFKKLLMAAQYILEIRGLKNYFSVGYEFESAHAKKSALDYFRQGATSIMTNIAETFGSKTKPKFGFQVLNGMAADTTSNARLADEDNAIWNVVQEWVRDGERTYVSAGWETVSPPLFNRDRLRNMAAFMIRLGANDFGREAEFTGAHQTFGLIPAGGSTDPNVIGLAAANFTLLQEQYIPAIFDLLKVERYGGPKNFFIRPIVFDHNEYLKQLAATPAQKLTIQYLDEMMNKTFAEFEFYHHVVHTDAYSEKEKLLMLSWSKEQQQAYSKIWKYRDLRVKFNRENPALTLVETRVGDYRSGAPEEMLNITYFYEKLLNVAYQMALNGRLFQIIIPDRLNDETDDAYWLRLKQNPAAGVSELFKTLKIDSNIAAMMLGKDFKSVKPTFSASDKITFGFEMEMQSENIVNIIVPVDPVKRAKWRKMSTASRLYYLQENLEFEFGEYSKDNFRLLVGEFQADNFTYPFLDPDLYLEESGNLEIKSHGRDLTDVKLLNRQMSQIEKQLGNDYFGAHVHVFLPEEKLAGLRNRPGKAEEFVSFLERLSLYLQVEDYKDVDREEPTHQVDSWSLDRFSPKDLNQILAYLKGQGPLDNFAQKFHNVGVRTVSGGLDVEFRTVGNDIPFSDKLVALVLHAMETMDFGIPAEFGKTRPLLHEPRDLLPEDQESLKIVNALSKKYKLSDEQKKIAYKLQFEIYKPSMPEYMDFYDGKEHYTDQTVPAEKLDPAQARTNFESNSALPILNYSEQTYMILSSEQKAKMAAAEDKYLATIYKLVLKVEKDPKAKFILEQDNFLYLADWMKRSTHPDKPVGPAVDKQAAKAQWIYLENLVFKVRRSVYDYVLESHVDQLVWSTMQPGWAGAGTPAPFGPGPGCAELFSTHSH